ncbi:MAG: translation elongation factor Ts [Candidatus Moraniibacteriota bacterium]|nr:MAG: elongation factor Ts [Candidatus Moranbacteria bacterium]
MSTMEQVKALREKTGGGIVEVKKALDEANGDEAKAIEILKKRGEAKALKKTGRTAAEGIVVSYIHSNKRVGTLLTLLCETDFVGRNEEFQELAHDLAMHVTAMAPGYIHPEDVPAETVASERTLWEEQVAAEGKPAAIALKILAGKEKKFREEQALLTQPFVKDSTKTVQALITEKIHRIGENIQIGRFTRFEI